MVIALALDMRITPGYMYTGFGSCSRLRLRSRWLARLLSRRKPFGSTIERLASAELDVELDVGSSSVYPNVSVRALRHEYSSVVTCCQNLKGTSSQGEGSVDKRHELVSNTEICKTNVDVTLLLERLEE